MRENALRMARHYDGDNGLASLSFQELPFPVRRSKLATLPGQDTIKWAHLASSMQFNEWARAFALAPVLQEPGAVSKLI
jgi:hypothetical protein